MPKSQPDIYRVPEGQQKLKKTKKKNRFQFTVRKNSFHPNEDNFTKYFVSNHHM